jgi:hypothetical protein
MTRQESESGVDDRVDRLLRSAAGAPTEPDAGFLRQLRSASADAFAAAAEAVPLEPAGLTRPGRAPGWARWLAMAAAAAVVLCVAMWAINPGPRAYAFEAVPDQIKKARTLHWVETEVTAYGTPQDRKLQTLTKEVWLDAEKGLYRDRYTDDVLGEDGRPLNDGEAYRDGQFATVINHGQRRAAHVRVNRLASLAEARDARRAVLGDSGLGDPAKLQAFQKTGQERVKGVQCDVWTGRVPRPSSGDVDVTAWVGASDGMLRKLHLRAVDAGGMNFVSRTVDVIDAGAAIPAGVFRCEVPKGYAVEEPKDGAPGEEFDRGFSTGNKYRVRLAFTLPGGSVIVGWNNFRSQRIPPAAFEGIQPGGPVPRLATVITALRTNGVPGGDIEFAGRHLAVTTAKDGETLEWSLFVPLRPPPPRERFFGYTFEFGAPEDGEGPRQKADYPGDVEIASAEDFDTFVRGAMAESSEGGAAPQHVRLDRVAALAESILKSAKAKPELPPVLVTPSGL